MIERTVSLTNRRGMPFQVDVRLPEGDGTFPVVIVCHGFKGFKNFAFFPYLLKSCVIRG